MAKIKNKTLTPTFKSEDIPIMNESEVGDIKESSESEVNEVATKRLILLLDIVMQKFNLDDTYGVRQFNDKGKVMSITLENEDFSVSITVKDSDRHGLVTEC